MATDLAIKENTKKNNLTAEFHDFMDIFSEELIPNFLTLGSQN